MVFILAISIPSIAQESENCEEIPTFIGIPEETLCEQYGGGAYDLILSAPSLNSASKLLAHLLTNTAFGLNIYVADDFYVDIDFNFNYCIIEIAPGKQIIVTGGVVPTPPGQYGNGAKLKIEHSKLFACEGLWKGIRLQKIGSQANILISEIEDAEIGVDAPYSSAIGLKGAVFDRNRIGVSLGRETGNVTSDNAPAFSAFSGNTFSCTAPLNGTTDEVSLAGVRVVRCPVTIHSDEVSKFTGSRFGIQVPGYDDYISTISVNNCHFEEVAQYGISVVRGALTVDFCLFRNWGKWGVYAQRMQKLQIENCGFEYQDYTNGDVLNSGVYGRFFLAGADVDITDNIFYQSLSSGIIQQVNGVFIEGGQLYDDVDIQISNNYFEHISRQGRCIFLRGEFPPGSSTNIVANDFVLDAPNSSIANSNNIGIHITDGDKNNISVASNTFDGGSFKHAANYAIWMEGSEGSGLNEISLNRFLPDSDFLFNEIYDWLNANSGVWIDDVDNVKYCGNEITDCRHSFYFKGINTGTALLGNEMTFGTYMLVVEQFIGSQVNAGNQWFNKEIPGFIYYPVSYATLGGSPEDNRIIVHTPSPSSYFPPIGSIDPPAWFTYLNILPQPSIECMELVSDEYFWPTDSTIMSLDEAEDPALTDPYPRWRLENYLYKKILEDESFLTSHPAYGDFFDEMQGMDEALKNELQLAKNESFRADEMVLSAVGQLENNRNALISEIQSIDALLNDSLLPGAFDSLILEKMKLLEELSEVDSSTSVVQSAYLETVNQGLQQVLQDWENAEFTSVFAENEKTVQTIFLESLINNKGELDSNQIQSLALLASDCPENAGDAVYEARGLLPPCHWATLLEEISNCEGSVESRPYVGYSLEAQNEGKPVQVFPNPSSGMVSITNLPLSAEKQIQIFNSLGHEIGRYFVTEQSSSLELYLDRPPGLYYLVISSEQEVSTTLRLVIQH